MQMGQNVFAMSNPMSASASAGANVDAQLAYGPSSSSSGSSSGAGGPKPHPGTPFGAAFYTGVAGVIALVLIYRSLPA